MKIHLLRHGKTAANQQRLYCGATDIPLAPEGIAELATLKTQNIYPCFTGEFFTSGLQRTTQTLGVLYGAVKSTPLPQCAEFHFGAFEMQSYDMLKNDPSYQQWITDEAGTFECPGGESRVVFTQRVLAGYEILQQCSTDVLLVCHGGVIATLMDSIYPNTQNFYQWQPAPGRGYTITVGEGYEAI